MDLTIVIPLYNEEESLPELSQEVERELKESSLKWQLIFIDDGSSDNSWGVIKELSESYPIRGVRFSRNYGKSAALYQGFKLAEGEVVITMDADLQDSPQEIVPIYQMVKEEGWDVVSGWKKKRYDNLFSKRIPSKIYNSFASFVTGIKLHDMNCGLKGYRKEVIKSIELYGEMHRYIPYLSKNAGYGKIGERVVKHNPRKYGKSKFGISRFVNGYLDLLSLWFLSKFGKRPMHLFGLAGTLTFILGGSTALYLMIEKIVTQAKGLGYRAVTDQPLFYISLVALIIGVQLFLAGFLAELISRSSTDRNNYSIREEI
ncbi:MAG: glycosyltransferase family 2 protein [Bacteroidales bacterium]